MRSYLADPSMPDSPLVRYLTDPWGYLNHLLDGTARLLASMVHWALLFGIALTILGLAIIVLRTRQRQRFASGAKRFLILPPSSAPDPDGATTLWMNLHALLRPALLRLLLGQPYLAWEVAGKGYDCSVSIWVAGGIPPGLVERAVESAWPGARVEEIASDLPIDAASQHVSFCELVLAEADHFPIGEGAGKDPMRMVLGTFGMLEENESAVVQILARPVTSAGRHHLRTNARKLRRGQNLSIIGVGNKKTPGQGPDPTLDADVRSIMSKAASPLWDVTLRIGVSSPSRAVARGKIHAIAGAFAVFEGRNSFRRRRVRRGQVLMRDRLPHSGFVLSAPELASIADLPTSEALPWLPRARARTVPPPRDLPSTGKPLGISDRVKRRVAISVEDAAHHMHIVGETGTGKSTLIAQMVLADAEAGRGAVVIDPKGDLVNAIVERLPASAIERTCLLDPDDPEMAVGLNVLAGEDTDLVVDHIVSVFKRIYEGAWGPRSDDIMRASCLTLAQLPDATLAEVPLLLTNRELRAAVRHRAESFEMGGDLRGFWDWYEQLGEQQRSQNTAPLMNKLRAFLLRGHVRAIVGQAKPKLDIDSLLEKGGLLLVRIPKGTLGEETSRILGAFVVARVWQAAMRRAGTPESKRNPLSLYVDEMHNYLALPRSFEDMLAEARGYGLSLVLAHQHMGQLPKEMREALAANARTKIVFACSPDDAKSLSKHFDNFLTEPDLANLAVYQAACRPCINGGHGPAFTFNTEPLATPFPDRIAEVRQAAAHYFAKSRHEVDAEIRRRQIRYRGGNP